MGFRDLLFIDDVIASIIKTINYKNKYDVFNVPNHQIIVEEGTPRDQFGIYGNENKAKELLR